MNKADTKFIVWIVFTFAFVLFGLQVTKVSAQGKLSRVRAEVRKQKPAPQKEKPAVRPQREAQPKPQPRQERDDDHDHDHDSAQPVKRVASSKGKLNQARNEVRRHEPAPRHVDSRGDRDSHNHGRDGGDRGRNNSRSSDRHWHRGGSRSSGVVYYAPPVTHVVHSAPLVIPVVETYPSAFTPVDVGSQPVFESEVLSGPATLVEPVIADYVLGNWFQENPSSLWATLGSDFDGITTGGLGFKFQSPLSIGLEGSVMTLRETGMDLRDHLWIGDLNLMGEIINRPRLRARVGLGLNWLADSWGSDAGFNLTAGADLKLTERLMLSLESDLGTLGDADFFHARVDASRRFGNVELMIGMDHFNIGGTEINNVFTGLQLRF